MPSSDYVLHTVYWKKFQNIMDSTDEELMNKLVKRIGTMDAVETQKELRKLIPGDDNDDVVSARRTRIVIVQLMYDCDQLKETDARDLLKGRLHPNKEETYFDDSALLKIKKENVENE